MYPVGLSDLAPVSVLELYLVPRVLASIVSSAPGHVMREGRRSDCVVVMVTQKRSCMVLVVHCWEKPAKIIGGCKVAS